MSNKNNALVLAFLDPQRIETGSADATFTAPAQIVWIPLGGTNISAGGGYNGEGFQGNVLCDAKAFANIQASFEQVMASGHRVWIDFNHEDAEAAGWVTGFSWDESRGILASVSWTPSGIKALEEKTYYSFSPAFLIDLETSRPSSLIMGHAAGGLVNAPAFGARMPALVAARMGATNSLPSVSKNPLHTTHMKAIYAHFKDKPNALLKAVKAAAEAGEGVDEKQIIEKVEAEMSADEQAAILAERDALKMEVEKLKAELEKLKPAAEEVEAVKAKFADQEKQIATLKKAADVVTVPVVQAAKKTDEKLFGHARVSAAFASAKA